MFTQSAANLPNAAPRHDICRVIMGTSDCDGESALNVPRAEGALILALHDCVNAVLAQHRVHARQDEYCAPLVHAHLQGTGQVVPGFGGGGWGQAPNQGVSM